MTKLEAILKEAQALTPSELAALIERLQAQISDERELAEQQAGRRGLAAWTESTRHEDWSTFYPPQLSSDGEPAR